MSHSASPDAQGIAATPAQLAAVDRSIARLCDQRGALLPILHDIQEQLGFVPTEAVARIASGLNLSRADVHGVLTYYHDFRTRAPGRHVLKLCRAEACQAMGSAALEARLRERHGVAMNATTADGGLTVEPVYCLGNCALSPSLQLDGSVLGRVSAERLDAIVAACGGEQ
ncbi:MAG: formate dehydrogenase subunit gamma [Planctomycetes bacterium]|nr:formate dehydrogenase subunit gamma [Planctomycetota bacterium]